MMKKITGIVLCLALLLSLGCAYAVPDGKPENESTSHSYAEPFTNVKLAYHLYETFEWSIPDDDEDMEQYTRKSFGTLKAWNVYVGNGLLNMYVSSDNEFELKFTPATEGYENLALDYDLYNVAKDGTAINKGTPNTTAYPGTNLYSVFTVTTAEEEKENTMYYEITEIPQINGTYDDYLTFYALVENN